MIGLSGGPDSVCLFHILHRLREELGISLHGVHINHGLRPGAAEEDQKYAEMLCADYLVPFHSFSFDINRIARESGISGEDAGRQVRYQSFFRIAQQVEAETGASVKVAVAQNMNDQAETVLMRILRGTGTDGLGGMEYLRKEKGKGILIRPLLDVSRGEVEAYCSEHGLNPRIDLTNLEPVYTRNKIRLDLLPHLGKNYNGNIIEALNRLSKISREDKDYFTKRVDEIIAVHAVFPESQKAAIPLRILAEQHPSIRRRLIVKLFENIGLTRNITSIHLEQADRLLIEGKTSSVTDFTAGYVMGISYGTVEFHQKSCGKSTPFEYSLNMDGSTEIPELNAIMRVKILRRDRNELEEREKKHLNEGTACRLSLDKVLKSGCKPVVRTRKPGDYIVPLGMQGRKKLQDFFVDEKYSREVRDRIPVLCLGSEIVWIVGGRISENYKVDEGAERIILLEYSTKM